ncbi:MAG: hypothetical protein AAGK17_08440 [Pseudomonadota bacterium]
MSKLEKQFEEDRALRNAALSVLKADVEHAKAALSGKAIASRVGTRVGDGAKDAFEIAKVHADDKRGILAALIGAVILWFVREPLLDILGLGSASDNTGEDSDMPNDDGEVLADQPDETDALDSDARDLDRAVPKMVSEDE